MPRTRSAYAPEFCRQMVDLVRAGRSPEELAKEFEPSSHSIRHWVRVSDQTDGRGEAKTEAMPPAERDELAKLRREVKQLRLEREILSRAAAGSASLPVPPGDRLRRWFAREAGVVPSGSSNS